MKREIKPERYSDLSFNPSLDQNGDFSIVKDNKSIGQALFTLFHTAPGTRVMAPGYGASLSPFLFEPFDESTASKMGNFIRGAIQRYEPRVNLDKVSININEDESRYEIELFYKIFDVQQTQSITFNLERL